MSAQTKETGGWPTGAKVVIGLIVAVIGFAFSKNVHLGFYDYLKTNIGLDLDLGKTVSVMGVVYMLAPVLNTFYYQPLKNAINDRHSELESTFSEAETLRNDMASMKREYEARLKETEENARQQIQDEIRKAQDMRQSLMAEASSKADEMVRKASEEIAAERERVIGELRIQTVNLALGAAGQLLASNVDNDKNRKLVEEFIEKAEVPV